MSNDSEARGATARIAASYDLVPYNPDGEVSPGLDISCLFGLAALHGDIAPRRDLSVLDLGCGGGAQLLRAAAETEGPLLGIDVSQAAIAEAETRCASLAPRCTVRQADILDLDPASLGVFDVIYMTGLYYVVPPAVQDRLIGILAHCLAPGGVALISYYAPNIWRSIDALRRSIRGAVDMTAPPQRRIEAARRHVTGLAWAGRSGVPERILQHALTCAPSTFFHEMLGEILAPVFAAELEARLAPAGVHFLNWMLPGAFASLARPDQRAAAADATPGGYHYAVFAHAPGLNCADAPWTHVLWRTRLRRDSGERGDATVFTDPASGQGVRIPHPGTATALDLLADGPRAWPEMTALLGLNAPGDVPISLVKNDFLTLWQQGVLVPLWGKP